MRRLALRLGASSALVDRSRQPRHGTLQPLRSGTPPSVVEAHATAEAPNQYVGWHPLYAVRHPASRAQMPFGREPHAAHEGKPRAGDAKTVYTSQPLARGGLAVVR